MELDETTTPTVTPPPSDPAGLVALTPASDDTAVAHHSPGRTLLPGSVASAISFATRTTSLAIRTGLFFGGFGFAFAKFTAVGSLEIGRMVLEGLMSRAGSDLVERSRGEMGRITAESILERSLANLHHATTRLVFWTSTGFQLTYQSVLMCTDFTNMLLHSLDQIFGSTDSSRAVASIITLMRREFQNPATGLPGERVGVADLLAALCGLAYLQHQCRRWREEVLRRESLEELVWDVVVLNSGERIDIEGPDKHMELVDASTNEKLVDAIERRGSVESSDDENLPEIRLKKEIMRNITADSTVTINTKTAVTKVITLEVKGVDPSPIIPPMGLELVSSKTLPPPLDDSGDTEKSPNRRIIYEFKKESNHSATIHGTHEIDGQPVLAIESDEEPTGQVIEENLEYLIRDDYESDDPPTPPPKTPMVPNEPLPDVTPLEGIEAFPAADSRTLPNLDSRVCPTPTTAEKGHRKVSTSTRDPVNSLNKRKGKKKKSTTLTTDEHQEKVKKANLRNTFRKGVSAMSKNLLQEPASSGFPGSRKEIRPPSPPFKSASVKRTSLNSKLPVSIPKRISSSGSLTGPRAAYHQTPSPVAPREIKDMAVSRSPSRASYVSVHESRRDSFVSQTDTYSIHAGDDMRPLSPSLSRTDMKAESMMTKSLSEKDIPESGSPTRPGLSHRRVKSLLYCPSIYTLRTSGSQASLVLSSFPKSPYSDSKALRTLRTTGMADGMFPRFHLLRNVARFMRFSSAAYGSSFLRALGINTELSMLNRVHGNEVELQAFAYHTGIEPENILLASFVDSQGGSDSSGSTNTNIPLCHYVSFDHESKAVVLACRGTLGFEDVLTDMLCDYDDLHWRGNSYQVHKGIHASARRILYGGDGKVLNTLKLALEQYPDYGVVLAGHSLGGAVTALLGVMLAEPSTEGTAFVTSGEPHQQMLTDGTVCTAPSTQISLPAGRPIHVYAYGPPGTMAPLLRKATRGLITSVVHGNDLVPYLSLGVLHDLQGVALSLKTDANYALHDMKARIWQSFANGMSQQWSGTYYFNDTVALAGKRRDDRRAYAVLQTLRSSMLNEKLVPPGEVFNIELTRVLRRDAFVQNSTADHIGRPAKRVVLKYVMDVEKRFREVIFRGSMLMDHSPVRYEDALNRLRAGVVG